MTSLDTTNVFLAVMAATMVLQFLLVLGIAIWMIRQLSGLRDAAVRFERTHLPMLADRTNAVIADLHLIATRAERVSREVERTARGARAILEVVEQRVERTARGVDVAFSLLQGGYRQAFAVGSGIREGLQEMLNGRRRRQERKADEDAIARFEAGA